MSGAHVDEWWPQDGPSRNGRMAWPPYVGEHRAEPYPRVSLAWDGTHDGPVQTMSFDPPVDTTIVGWSTEPFEIVLSTDGNVAREAARSLDRQIIKDVWSGNPDTDRFWSKEEDLPRFLD